MWNKFKTYFDKYLNLAKCRINNMQSPIRYMIISYLLLVILLISTYYGAWLYQAFFLNKIVMSDLLAIIREMIGTAMIGFITFIAGCFVDVNGNGIPDRFEKQGVEEHEKPRQYKGQ